MNCPRCGTPLPANARFCYACGANLGAPSPVPPPPPGYPAYGGGGGPGGFGPMPGPPPPPPAAAPSAPRELKCPSCGAPITPEMGEAVVTCAYCGGTVSLAGTGWKAVTKHSMLMPSAMEPETAIAAIKAAMDQGMFHHHEFEDSKIVDSKLQFVPFWIVPVSATTSFTYQDMTASVGGTVGTIAAAELLGSALGGGRGGGFVPFVVAPPVNATRQDQISGQYEFPIIAARGLAQFQPKDYQFALDSRQPFNRSAVPGGAPLLNGDLDQASAQQAARAHVMQLQAEAARKRHHMVQQIQTQCDTADPELVHVPIWRFVIDHKGQTVSYIIDGHQNRVMLTIA
jgi:ribosomal protein L37AE/L43A